MIERQQLQDILTEVNKVCIVAAQERKAKESRGEYYNVFNVLGLWSDEERLHSAFIAELLNPNGIHGLGDKFLKAFLKQATIDEDYINANDVKPDIVERNIGRKNEDETEGGRIDIILDDSTHALIIENKIYAGDQYNQLQRYSTYAKQKFAGFKLIYLTLDGHEASTYSTGNVDKKEPLDGHEADEVSTEKNVDYNCMSYREDIIAWLTECAKIAFAHPLVRETINQYIQLIKQLTNINMEDKDINEVAKLAIEKDIDSTVAIIEAQYEICRLLRVQYIFEPLKAFAKGKGLNLEIIEDGHSIKFSRPNWNGANIQVRNDMKTPWNNMYIGITYGNDNGKIIFQLDCFSDKPNKWWPYGSDWIQPRDWDSPSSYKAIKDGKVAEWIKDKINQILSELKDKNITL